MAGDAPEEPHLPLEEDVMRLARFGEIGQIQKLFDTGKATASYKDASGVTPLHWAAIHNHYATCHFLIQAGADVNALGGDLNAPPILWAAREAHVYIVNLLLQHGADPYKNCAEGYDLIQTATMNGDVFQLLFILHQDITVDTRGLHGHTNLMWGAYKGLPRCVETLLMWGADIAAKDNNDFTALHWGLVRGNRMCIQKLLEYGADRSAVTKDGKTPDICAKEMNSVQQYHGALSDCGLNPDGSSKAPPPWLSPFLWLTAGDVPLFISRLLFFWPFAILGCAIYSLAHLPTQFLNLWWPGSTALTIVLSVGVCMVLYLPIGKVLSAAPPSLRRIHHTPFMAGVFSNNLFWVGILWVARILPYTWRIVPITNLIFAVLCFLCSYFYFTTMFENPGYIPKSASRQEQRGVVQDLVEQNMFDKYHFCIPCGIRKPLRSKHCKGCGRCVAKMDHHCPWVNNCVAINNHRHFLLYLMTMEVGVSVVAWLTWKYLEALPQPTSLQCNVSRGIVCEVLNKDPFTLLMIIWTSFQLTWITILIFAQLLLISRGQTTLEDSAGKHPSDSDAVITSTIMAGTTSPEAAGLTGEGGGPDQQTSRPEQSGSFQKIKRLLGLDSTMAVLSESITTAMHGSRAPEFQARQRQNPFTRGCFTNLGDFFLDTAPVFGQRQNGEALLGGEKVDYTLMYELPSYRREGGYASVGQREDEV